MKIKYGEWVYGEYDMPHCAVTHADEWEAYLNYLVNWAIDHTDPNCEGMSPASYNEWRDNEYEAGK